MEKENIITIEALAAESGLRVVVGSHIAAIRNEMVLDAVEEDNNIYIDTINAGSPLDVVEKCRQFIEKDFSGILYTNNPVAVESLSVFSRDIGDGAIKLYLTIDDMTLENISDNHEKFYRTVAAAYDAIDEVAAKL